MAPTAAMVLAYFKIRISTHYPIYLVPTTVLLGGYYDVIGLCAQECTVVIYLIVYFNSLSKNFSRRHIDIFFSEKQDLTQTGGSPPGLGCGCKEFYPAPGV